MTLLSVETDDEAAPDTDVDDAAITSLPETAEVETVASEVGDEIVPDDADAGVEIKSVVKEDVPISTAAEDEVEMSGADEATESGTTDDALGEISESCDVTLGTTSNDVMVGTSDVAVRPESNDVVEEAGSEMTEGVEETMRETIDVSDGVTSDVGDVDTETVSEPTVIDVGTDPDVSELGLETNSVAEDIGVPPTLVAAKLEEESVPVATDADMEAISGVAGVDVSIESAVWEAEEIITLVATEDDDARTESEDPVIEVSNAGVETTGLVPDAIDVTTTVEDGKMLSVETDSEESTLGNTVAAEAVATESDTDVGTML